MRRRGFMIIGMAVMVAILLMPKPVSADIHEPTGEQANSGTWEDGDFIAFVETDYDDDYWTHANAYDYYGDLYAKGASDPWTGPHVLDYYCLIKIKPEDSGHKYLQLKTDAWFHYGISAGWFAYARWYIIYVVLYTVPDPSDPPQDERGWSHYSPGDRVDFDTHDNRHYHTSDAYKNLYDDDDGGDLYVFYTSRWYYVGIRMRLILNGWSDFYRYSEQEGNAWFNPSEISWIFFED